MFSLRTIFKVTFGKFRLHSVCGQISIWIQVFAQYSRTGVFQTIFSSTVSSAAPSSSKNSPEVSSSPSSVLGAYPPSSSGDCPPPSTKKAGMTRHYVSSSKKLISQLQLEACTKAKEAAKHPSYTSLVLSLIHKYNLFVNEPVLDISFTIFHCACPSGSLELVSSLSPIADIHRLTDQGDCPGGTKVPSTSFTFPHSIPRLLFLPEQLFW